METRDPVTTIKRNLVDNFLFHGLKVLLLFLTGPLKQKIATIANISNEGESSITSLEQQKTAVIVLIVHGVEPLAFPGRVHLLCYRLAGKTVAALYWSYELYFGEEFNDRVAPSGSTIDSKGTSNPLQPGSWDSMVASERRSFQSIRQDDAVDAVEAKVALL